MLSRRGFLKVAAASAPMIISARALGLEGPSANETINIGLIGLGGRCRDIAATCLKIPQMRIAAVCDCYKPRVDSAVENLSKETKATGYTDFRKMIEKEKLDGVMVETTTHARAWVACHAMAMGMDVYIEKPMCLTIAEGREMVKVARKHKRVTQVGTQQRSMPLNNWASDLVKNGALGKSIVVKAPNFMSPLRWEDKPGEEMPAGGDDKWWDIWTNQAVMRPYHSSLHHDWARWWDYDGGGLCFGVTGWGAHSYDQIQRGLGTDETGPIEVRLEEPVTDKPCGLYERATSEEETGVGYYNMAKGLVGPRARITMKYANGAVLDLCLDSDFGPGLGAIFTGENGSIDINRDKILAAPADLVNSPDRPAPLQVLETQPHIENWLECIKTRQKCNADIEIGHRSSTVCYLVNIAREVGRVGETLNWNPDKEKFTNCDEGNKLLSRPRRKGYKLPS
ncbi:MAG: Gfo/Idh/MocA family oxidoreductase [Candidatus Hydrogenedentes bacterium]|nr:Gfo/Idh/MocA family oxidoreductase [Candidatus Hydrogenedentota bacterium]